MNYKYRISIAILIQSIIASIFFVYYYHGGIGMKDARWTKHIVYIFWLGAIYLLGLYGWKGYKEKWVITIWNWGYATVFAFLLTAAAIEKWYGTLPFGLLETTAALRFYFQTPIPFLVVMLMAKFKWYKL